MNDISNKHYFPAIVCSEHDSPIDALVELCVPQDDARDLVAASWCDGHSGCLLATINGGRAVAVIRTPQGHWAACKAYPEFGSANRSEAERHLRKLLRRGRVGLIGVVTAPQTVHGGEV